MITSIEIENFRGIRTGRLEGLGALTVLTGPNGCGKSSVLDALLIGAHWIPGEAVGRAINRRTGAIDGGRWLFLDRNAPARILLRGTGTRKEELYERRLGWIEQPSIEPEFEKLASRQAPGPYRQIACLDGSNNRIAQVFLAIDNTFIPRREGLPRSPIKAALFIDPSIPVPLDQAYSETWRLGKRDEALELLRVLINDLESIDILTEANREARLYLTRKGGAVPVAVSGDGIQALLQTVLELALVPEEGLALIEEPESYLHRRAIFQSAKLLVETARRGRQVVLTTHSLELIDAILGYSGADDDGSLALFNLRLSEGKLESSRWSGEEMRFARNQIEEDLR